MEIQPPLNIETREAKRRFSFVLVVSTFIGAIGLLAFLVWYYTKPTPYEPVHNGGNGGGTLPTPQVQDTKAPTTPMNVKAEITTSLEVILTWNPSTDDIGVEGYRVYRDGTLIGSALKTTFTDTSVEQSRTYTYVITAFDNVQHESLASDDKTITIQKTGQPPVNNITPTTPSGSTISNQTSDSGMLSVRNFYTDAEAKTSDDVVIRNNNYYTLFYFPHESSFLITLNDTDVHRARAVAELELPDILKVSKQDLCRLVIFITIPFDVNEKYSKENYTLSFCPGGKSF